MTALEHPAEARPSSFEPYLRRHAFNWSVAVAATLGAVLMSLVMPRAIGWIIDDLRQPVAAGEHVVGYAAALLLAAVASSALYVLMRRFGASTSRRVAYEIRRDIFARLTQLEPAFYSSNRTGDLMNRLTGDLGAVQEMLGFGFTQAVNTTFIMLLTLSMMLQLSWRLGLVVLAIFPLVIGLLVFLLRVIARRYARVQEAQSRIAARAQENFSGMRVVKGYAVEDREQRDYLALNRDYRLEVLALARVEAPLWATVALLMNLVFVTVLYFAAQGLLRSGHDATFAGLTLGRLVTFTTYLFQLSWPMLSIGVVANIFQRGVVSWSRLRDVLTAQVSIGDGPLTDHALTALSGAIVFEHVSLELGGRRLLDDVNLRIAPGSRVGVTGRTGAGKTLLMALITRQLEPTAGRVSIGGHPLSSIPLAVLRHHLGVVAQEPFLFSDSLAENIGFGVEGGLAPARVRAAAEVAGIAEEFERLPQGFETRIGERGITLSGGQRQRTALARAIARQPAVLLLDDALSAVDTETEARILTQLAGERGGQTTIIIAHRISTLREADQIVVLAQGRIAEQGTHDELLARGGLYARLDEKQRLERALEASEREEVATR